MQTSQKNGFQPNFLTTPQAKHAAGKTLPKAIQYASGSGSKPSIGLFQQLSTALLDIFTEEVEEAPIGISQLSRQTFRQAEVSHPTSAQIQASQSQSSFQSQPFRNQPFQDYRFPGLVQDSQA
ncbi:MAG: hypothetical protein K2X01_02820 [Cyanobacteria bacterium]|nr:hypothetical protein [Cyanobacteriota bacterium]